MFQCPNCGTRFNPQIDTECPKCKENRLEATIADQWKAIEQNLIIIEQYLKEIKQHREERDKQSQDIEEQLQDIEELRLIIHKINPPYINDIVDDANYRAADQAAPDAKPNFEYDFRTK